MRQPSKRLPVSLHLWMSVLSLSGYVTPQKSGVGIVPFTQALMESINIADGNDEKKSPDAIPRSSLMPLRSHLTITSVTITYRTMNHVMKVTTGRKTRLNLISNTLTRSRKVVSLTKLLTSRLLVQASASLYSCATWLAPSCSKDGTFCTLQWKWQKRKLLNELTQTY